MEHEGSMKQQIMLLFDTYLLLCLEKLALSLLRLLLLLPGKVLVIKLCDINTRDVNLG